MIEENEAQRLCDIYDADLSDPDLRAHVRACMKANGLTEETISLSVSNTLRSLDTSVIILQRVRDKLMQAQRSDVDPILVPEIFARECESVTEWGVLINFMNSLVVSMRARDVIRTLAAQLAQAGQDGAPPGDLARARPAGHG